jgi:hypothetical protein
MPRPARFTRIRRSRSSRTRPADAHNRPRIVELQRRSSRRLPSQSGFINPRQFSASGLMALTAWRRQSSPTCWGGPSSRGDGLSSGRRLTAFTTPGSTDIGAAETLPRVLPGLLQPCRTAEGAPRSTRPRWCGGFADCMREYDFCGKPPFERRGIVPPCRRFPGVWHWASQSRCERRQTARLRQNWNGATETDTPPSDDCWAVKLTSFEAFVLPTVTDIKPLQVSVRLSALVEIVIIFSPRRYSGFALSEFADFSTSLATFELLVA